MYNLATASSARLPTEGSSTGVRSLHPAPLSRRSTPKTPSHDISSLSPSPSSLSSRRKPIPSWYMNSEGDQEAEIVPNFWENGGLSASTSPSCHSSLPTTPITPNLPQIPQGFKHSIENSPAQQYLLSVDEPLQQEDLHWSVRLGPDDVCRTQPKINPRSSSFLEDSLPRARSAHAYNPSSSAVPIPRSSSNFDASTRPSRPDSYKQTPYISKGPESDSSMNGSTPIGLAIANVPVETESSIVIANSRLELQPQVSNVSRSVSTSALRSHHIPLPQPRSNKSTDQTHQPPKSKIEFSVDALVDPLKLWEASHSIIKDEFGRKRRFGDFFDTTSSPAVASRTAINRKDTSSVHSQKSISRRSKSEFPIELPCGGEEWNIPGRKTVVFYIRHFWCGQCQDFTFASLSTLDASAINAAGLNVIVISNGNWRIIKRYRELFKCPYPIYVDESRQLYEKMGMVLLTNDFGPLSQGRAAYHQRAVPNQLIHGLKKGFVDLPLRNPGKFTQLGGEFVLGPGLKCHFAHRMTNTSNHLEAFDVLQIAGCDKPTFEEQQARKLAEAELVQIAQLQQEEEEWKRNRHDEIDRIRRMKAERRKQLHVQNYTIDDLQNRRLSVPLEEEEAFL